MKLGYSLDRDMFVALATQIAEVATAALKIPYATTDVEISFALADYQDGAGLHLICRALLRNPSASHYDMIADVLGPPEEALQSLLEELKKKVPSFQSKVKKSLLN